MTSPVQSPSAVSLGESSNESLLNNAPPSPALLQILSQVAAGTLNVEQAAGNLSAMLSDARDQHSAANGIASIPGATVDLGRQARCGFGEVIYGEGKSVELMIRIVQTQLDAGQSCLITRIDPTAAAQLRRQFPHTHHNPLARTLRIAMKPDRLVSPVLEPGVAHVAVVTAGSTDAAVAEEAVETLAWMNISLVRVEDIGVAGPQRLLAALPMLREAAAIVVIAGMEGALPPAVAGHVAVPVVAVPTSMGYGANFAGLTPLMGMLTSCAPNVAVVNIDAGFKGAYIAGLIAAGLRAERKALRAETTT